MREEKEEGKKEGEEKKRRKKKMSPLFPNLRSAPGRGDPWRVGHA
jgi:hypothetical protein